MIDRVPIPLAVFVGGAMGSLARLAVVAALEAGDGGLVAALLVVNVSGAFALGWLLADRRSASWLGPAWFGFLATGLIGSYTTFSSYAVEGVEILDRSTPLAAVAFLAGSVAVGLAAAIAGRKVGERG